MKVAYFLWGFGLILIALGLRQLAGCIAFLRRSVRTDGRLVAWEAPQVGDSVTYTRAGEGRYHCAVVAYAAEDGTEHRVRSTVRRKSVSGRPKVDGRTVAVRYDPTNPKDARVATVVDYWLFPLATLAIGIFLVLLALRPTT